MARSTHTESADKIANHIRGGDERLVRDAGEDCADDTITARMQTYDDGCKRTGVKQQSRADDQAIASAKLMISNYCCEL